MKKREFLIIAAAVVLLVISATAGRTGTYPDGGSGLIAVDAAQTTPTADPTRPTPTADPTRPTQTAPSPTPTKGATGTTSTPTPTQTPSPTPTPVPVVDTIYAYYKGKNVTVGEELNIKDVVVTAYMSNHTMQTITKFEVSDTVVARNGVNRFTVFYAGKTCEFTVIGRILTDVKVELDDRSYGLFNSIDKNNLKITAYYNDSSTEDVTEGYTILPEVFSQPGLQTVQIMYGGRTVSLEVNVDAFKPVRTLYAAYTGRGLFTGQEIDRRDLTVTAIYEDEKFTTETISSYTLLTPSFEKAGENELIVEYLDVKCSVTVNVTALAVVSITAEYTGEEVMVGEQFDPAEMHVHAVYNDGSEADIDDYDVYDPVIRYLGDNTLRISAGTAAATVVVTGCAYREPDFSYVSEYTIRSGANIFTLTTAIPRNCPNDCTEGKLLKKGDLRKIFRRMKRSDDADYIGFTYGFTDDEYEDSLPVTVRITLPEDFDPAFTELYYTPNKKTIAAKLNKMGVGDGVIETTVFKVGTYMLVYDPGYEAVEEEENADEE